MDALGAGAAAPPDGLPPDGLLPDGLPPWAVVSPDRRAHVERVVEMVTGWAREMGVGEGEQARWRRVAWLHDALRDAGADELARLAPGTPGPPALRHGPASAARAKAEGETDRSILDGVRYHSLGLAEWGMAGRALYCADYLEPGREFDRERRAELARRFPDAPTEVLREVARARLVHLATSGWPLLEPTVRFWNSLVAPGSGSR